MQSKVQIFPEAGIMLTPSESPKRRLRTGPKSGLSFKNVDIDCPFQNVALYGFAGSGGNKCLPELEIALDGTPRILGMPLHAKAKRLSLDFDSFGHAVGCAGDKTGTRSYVLNAAMVR